MDFVKTFAEIGKADVAEAGGKGASLGELVSAGLPMPPGFVVLASAFEKFLADTDLGVEISAVLDTVDTSAMHTVEHASEKIHKLILTAEFSPDLGKEILQAFRALGAEFVAVRSSATAEDSAGAAWAGQLETYLNTTKEDLLRNIQKCWASLYTPRAIFYGFEKGYHQSKQKAESSKQEEADSNQQSAVEGQMSDVNGQGSISVAVVVQSMVQSEVAGIAFSVHPVTEDHNQLIIEAGYGLGEAVVSGQVTPDSYVVTKEPLEIIDKNISEQQKMLVRSEQGGNTWVPTSVSHPERSEGSHIAEDEILRSQSFPQNDGKKQKLSDEQIIELAKLIVKIEQHYGTPQDIEWAWAAGPEQGRAGKFYITQSRPITTLRSNPEVEASNTSLDLSDYESLFQLTKVPYFVNDILLCSYKSLDTVFFLRDGMWWSYLYKKAFDKTLEDGKKLFSSKEITSNWLAEFEAYIIDSEYFFEQILLLRSISSENATEYINQVVKLHYFYIKTEFFYTDRVSDIVDQSQREFAIKVIERAKTKGREYLNKLYFGPDCFVYKILKKLSSDFAIPVEELEEYSVEEISQLTGTGLRVDKSVISSRKVAYITISRQGVVEKNCGKEALEIISKLKVSSKFGSGLSGLGVVGGLVVGEARVFSEGYDKSDQKRKEFEHSFNSDDILVVDSTSPRMTTMATRAKAIVTNQSGLLSHAAIIAREFNIPCIVGTKIATQVLHDGDLVEVDADNGVVRVLEKAQKH